MSVVVDNINN